MNFIPLGSTWVWTCFLTASNVWAEAEEQKRAKTAARRSAPGQQNFLCAILNLLQTVFRNAMRRQRHIQAPQIGGAGIRARDYCSAPCRDLIKIPLNL
jgi:hypothetical protein